MTVRFRPAALAVALALALSGCASLASRPGDTVRAVLPRSAFEPAIPLVFPWEGGTARLEAVEQLESGVDFDVGLYRAASSG